MKRGRLLICLALLSVAVGLLIFALVCPSAREPVHLGRPLREWLVEFDYGGGSTNYSAAQEAIRAMGTNCLPFLIGYLRSKDPPLHRQWVSLKARLGLSPNGAEYAVFWKARASTACGELGHHGAPAFPAMMEAMNDESTADHVREALKRMLPKSGPVLTNLLATGNVRARCGAADALIWALWHPEIEEMALTALLSALRDPDPGLRSIAASAFHYWNKRSDVVVPALARALSDPNANVRMHAATSLGSYGSAAKPAVPDLLKLLHDTTNFPSIRALEVLQKIDPEAAAGASRSETRR